MTNLLKRLQEFNDGNKSRGVSISIPNGYTCSTAMWEVVLTHENGYTYGYECSFFTFEECDEDEPMSKERVEELKKYLKENRDNGIVFAYNPQKELWPGLQNTLEATLDAFESGVFTKDRIKTNHDYLIDKLNKSLATNDRLRKEIEAKEKEIFELKKLIK